MTFATRFTQATGSVVVVLGAVLGLYVGVYLCLVGGVIDILHAIEPLTVGLLALGILKVFLFDITGIGIFVAGVMTANWLNGGPNK